MKKLCATCQQEFTDEDLETCPDDGGKLLFLDEVEEDPLIGTTVDGRYVVQGLLGAGGMGSVYRAHQKTMNRGIALKVLKRELSSDPQIVKRFLREVQVVSVLRHPNTIMVYDFGQTPENLLYIAMELLEGRELSNFLSDQGALSVMQALEIASQVCGSLSEAHEKGVVHRDLKPDNIYLAKLGGQDVVKVLDFGIAKLDTGNEQTQLTRSGLTVGTPPYMSPEQAEGRREITAASDLYSLGCIMYECLTGRPPFIGESPVKILMDHCTTPPQPMSAVNPGLNLPPVIEETVMRLLLKDVSQRPQSAHELQKHFDNLRMGGTGTMSAAAPPPPDVGYDSTAAWDSSEVSAAVANQADVLGPTGAWGSSSGMAGAVPPGQMLRPATDLAGEAVPSSTAAAMASVRRGGFPVVPFLVTLLVLGAGAGGLFVWKTQKEKGNAAMAVAVPVEPDKKAAAAEQKAAKPAKKAEFWLTSEPEGAAVSDDDKELGVTPMKLQSKDKPWKLTVSHKGYKASTVTVLPGWKEPILEKLERVVRTRQRSRQRPRAKPSGGTSGGDEDILVDDLK